MHKDQDPGGLNLPQRTSPRIFEVYANQPSRHSEKPYDILSLIRNAVHDKQAFAFVSFTKSDMYRLKIVNFYEFSKWITYLEKDELISFDDETRATAGIISLGSEEFVTQGLFALSEKGWVVLEEKSKHGENYAFIAQDFDMTNRVTVNEKISEACLEAIGFEARPVDQDPNENDYIPDKILDSITKCSVMIADLTKNNKGVYYEAGFAKGLGKKVILLVNKDRVHTDKIHFDLKQFEQIRYSDESDLKEKLLFRLKVLFPDYEIS